MNESIEEEEDVIPQKKSGSKGKFDLKEKQQKSELEENKENKEKNKKISEILINPKSNIFI